MRHERIDLQYRLTFETAFHFGTGLRAGLVHRAIARDAAGFVFVPGSTLKGTVRDLATRITELFALPAGVLHAPEGDVQECTPNLDLVTQIFGSRWHPGGLSFDDARLEPEAHAFFDTDLFRSRQTETRTRVSMSRVTGTARSGLLFSGEYGLHNLRFEGRIGGVLRGHPTLDAPDYTYSLVLLVAALSALEGLGGGKSAGAGRVTCAITSLTVDGVVRSPTAYLEHLPDLEFYALFEDDKG